MPGKWVKPGSERELPSQLTNPELRAIIATLFNIKPEQVIHYVVLAYSENSQDKAEIYHTLCCNEGFALVNPHFRPSGISTSVDSEQ